MTTARRQRLGLANGFPPAAARVGRGAVVTALAALVGACGGGGERQWDCVIPGDSTPDHAARVGCLDDFHKLASRPLEMSIPGARSAKTIVDRAQQNRLYLINSNLHPRHYQFAADFLSEDGLPPVPDVGGFNQTAYYSPERRFLLGAVTLYEGPDIFAYELAPYDTSTPEMLQTTLDLLRDNTYFGSELRFHPTSSAQAELAVGLVGASTVTEAELFDGNPYQPLNPGEAYGQLRFFTARELETQYVGPRDVVVLDSVPNDISVVAAIVTSTRQTPLSHVNVLSQNRGTPNMALVGAYDDADLRALENQWVRIEVGAFEYSMEQASKSDADGWWNANRPPPLQVPALDLSVLDLRDTENIQLSDVNAFGGKAANYGVLSRLGDAVPHPKAFAVPVAYYKQFEQQHGFDVRIAALIADPQFSDDPSYRKAELEQLQADMLSADVDDNFRDLLFDKLATDFADTRMRFRSSTNAEDLESFSGAGLYSSKSGALGDPMRPVLDAVRFTWASLWNFRAFEERTHNGISQDGVAMALLVHHSFPDEEANGVALTNNIFDPSEPAFFVNVQAGEFSVVAPTSGVTTDSYLHYFYHPGQPTTYFSKSNLIPETRTVLTPAQIGQLGAALDAIHQGFAEHFERPNAFYAMDVEFKFDDLDSGDEPRLWVKQARPHPGWAGN